MTEGGTRSDDPCYSEGCYNEVDLYYMTDRSDETTSTLCGFV